MLRRATPFLVAAATGAFRSSNHRRPNATKYSGIASGVYIFKPLVESQMDDVFVNQRCSEHLH